MKRVVIEEWRKIPGFEEYQVSNLGRFKSKATMNGKKRSGTKQSKISKPPGGIALYKEGHEHRFRMAQVVLLAFEGPLPKTYRTVARHLDDNPANNQLDNLAWGSYKDNYHDSVRNGRRGPGSPCAIANGLKHKGKTVFPKRDTKTGRWLAGKVTTP